MTDAKRLESHDRSIGDMIESQLLTRGSAYALVERDIRRVSENRIVVTLDPTVVFIGLGYGPTLMEAVDSVLTLREQFAKWDQGDDVIDAAKGASK